MPERFFFKLLELHLILEGLGVDCCELQRLGVGAFKIASVISWVKVALLVSVLSGVKLSP